MVPKTILATREKRQMGNHWKMKLKKVTGIKKSDSTEELLNNELIAVCLVL